MERFSPVKIRITQDYTSAYLNPIKLKKGEQLLSFEEKESKWKGWFWCKSSSQITDWVPKSYLDIKNKTTATMLKDYDATELTVKIGNILTVILEEGGWLWCSSQNHKQGWIPKENTSTISS